MFVLKRMVGEISPCGINYSAQRFQFLPTSPKGRSAIATGTSSVSFASAKVPVANCTQLYISQRIHERLGNEVSELPNNLIGETKEISAMLQGLIRSVKRRSESSESEH
jgi:hypothetical protein